MKKHLPFLFLLISVLTPILFITSGMRLALSPVFFNLEYRLPNFPEDEYGFSREDRLRWADFSIAYIAGRLDQITFAEAKFENGKQLFNEREISHMIDVRDLTVVMLWIWRLLLILFIAAYLFSSRQTMQREFLIALNRGSQYTIALIAAIILFLVINFNQLFTLFHQIFFEGDTWLFYYSDTLIRLFPLKFWQDLFIFIGMISLVLSLMVILLNRRYKSQIADSE